MFSKLYIYLIYFFFQSNIQNNSSYTDISLSNRTNHQQIGHVQLNDINRNGHQNSHARSPTCHERPSDNVVDSHPVDLSSPKPQNRYGHMSYVNISRDNSSSSYVNYNNRQASNYENGMDTNQSDFSSKCGNILFYALFYY